MCLYVLSSVLWCPLRFPHEKDVRFVFTSSCSYEGSYLIYVIGVCLRNVVSNTHCVVFLLCCSSSCVQYVSSFLGKSQHETHNVKTHNRTILQDYYFFVKLVLQCQSEHFRCWRLSQKRVVSTKFYIYVLAHILFTWLVFVCGTWCPTHIALCFCFVVLRLVYNMFPVSQDWQFFIGNDT
jgi:hypothetical protein